MPFCLANVKMASAASRPHEDFHLGPKLPRKVQILLQILSISLRDGRLLHMDDVEFALEAIRVAAATFQNVSGVRSRSDADQNALLHAPGLILAV